MCVTYAFIIHNINKNVNKIFWKIFYVSKNSF